MIQALLACRDCGQIHRVPPGLRTDRGLLCRRCGRRLWRSPHGGLGHSLAFAATAMILFVLAITFALFEISLAGEHRSGFIVNGEAQLTQYNLRLAAVGVLAGIISILAPALTMVLVVTVVGCLVSGHRENMRARPTIAACRKLASHIRPWSMLDVYLLGSVVGQYAAGPSG